MVESYAATINITEVTNTIRLITVDELTDELGCEVATPSTNYECSKNSWVYSFDYWTMDTYYDGNTASDIWVVGSSGNIFNDGPGYKYAIRPVIEVPKTMVK